jgi:hypothetical protein
MLLDKMIHKTLLTVILFCGMTVMCHAQIKISDLFREMPDSLLPVLSEDNRLDMIDFMASGMKAEVSNRLGGRSEMTMLTDDSLRVKVSDALTVTLLLITPSDSIENDNKIICFIRTYGTDEFMLQSVTSFYTIQWNLMDQTPPLNNEDSQRIHALDMQTIHNWERSILKKD